MIVASMRFAESMRLAERGRASSPAGSSSSSGGRYESDTASATAHEHADDERDAGGDAHGLPRVVAHIGVGLFRRVLRLLHDFFLRVGQALTRHAHGFRRTLARTLD